VFLADGLDRELVLRMGELISLCTFWICLVSRLVRIKLVVNTRVCDIFLGIGLDESVVKVSRSVSPLSVVSDGRASM
jgi:hypothetical protein